MLQVCKFNKVADIQEHVPSLSTDINKAIETNTVQDTGIASECNEISDLNAIRGRVGDVFEAIDAQKEVLSRGRVVKPSASPESAPVGKLSSPEDNNS